MPMVSIVLPTHNRAHLLGEAMASVLAQTFPDWELIVVDDGSTDRTREIVAAYAARDRRISYVAQANGGDAAARNTGIRRAKGRLIAFLDDDDLWQPEKLQRQLALLNANPRLGFVYCPMLVQYPDGHRQGTKPARRWPDTWEALLAHSFIPMTTLVRRECFDVCGVFDESLRRACDYDLWVRITRRFAFQGTDEALAIVRVHGANMTRGAQSRQHQAHVGTLKKLLRDADLSARHRQILLGRLTKELHWLGKTSVQEGQGRQAFWAFLEEIRTNPLAGREFITASDAWPQRVGKLLKPYLAVGYAFLGAVAKP